MYVCVSTLLLIGSLSSCICYATPLLRFCWFPSCASAPTMFSLTGFRVCRRPDPVVSSWYISFLSVLPRPCCWPWLIYIQCECAFPEPVITLWLPFMCVKVFPDFAVWVHAPCCFPLKADSLRQTLYLNRVFPFFAVSPNRLTFFSLCPWFWLDPFAGWLSTCVFPWLGCFPLALWLTACVCVYVPLAASHYF